MTRSAARPPGVSPHEALFLPVLGGLVALAWLALALWTASPYGRYVEHDWTSLGLAADLCAALPAGRLLLPALLYVSGWLLMSVAMMLPTMLPLLRVFARLVRGRPDAARLNILLIGGYLLVWLAFGLTAHLAGTGLVLLVRRWFWLALNGWAIGAALLLLAGLFQFSALKYHCLQACRTPMGFVLARWRGRRPGREALRLGLAHGAFCLGCCWALMLLLFGVGTGSVGWMLALASVMALEKNSRWGRRLARPLGAALISAAVAVIALNLWA